MGGIFSKDKNASRITEQDQAILVSLYISCTIDCVPILTIFSPSLQKLKKQRDQLRQYQKKIEAVLEKDRQLAKKLLSNGQKE